VADSSVPDVMIDTVAPSCNDAVRSVSVPSTTAATAAFFRPEPMAAARSSAVASSASSRSDPSGRETVMFDMEPPGYEPWRGSDGWVLSTGAVSCRRRG
jgi:hypothetical protein